MATASCWGECVGWSSTCRCTAPGETGSQSPNGLTHCKVCLECFYALFCYSVSRCQFSLCCLMSWCCSCVCFRLLSVLCSNLDSFLLLESQYNICSMLLHSQRENVTDVDSSRGYELLNKYFYMKLFMNKNSLYCYLMLKVTKQMH